MSTIAVIGAGNVGAAVGQNWARTGHRVIYGVRDTGSDRVRAALDASGPSASAATPSDAAKDADAILLAVPWPAAEEAVRGLGNLQGKLLMDATNPLVVGPEGLALEIGHTESGGERVAGWAPGANVVKTLNHVGAEVMSDPSAFETTPVMYAAGDDADAKSTSLRLISDLGFEARDAGPLRAARLLEPFAMTWIHMALVQGEGRDWAFAVSRRK